MPCCARIQTRTVWEADYEKCRPVSTGTAPTLPTWEGRATVGGKVSKGAANVLLTAGYIRLRSACRYRQTNSKPKTDSSGETNDPTTSDKSAQALGVRRNRVMRRPSMTLVDQTQQLYLADRCSVGGRLLRRQGLHRRPSAGVDGVGRLGPRAAQQTRFTSSAPTPSSRIRSSPRGSRTPWTSSLRKSRDARAAHYAASPDSRSHGYLLGKPDRSRLSGSTARSSDGAPSA